MSILSRVPLGHYENQHRQHRLGSQTKAYEPLFLMGTVMGLLGLVMILTTWIAAILALDVGLAWFLIGFGGTCIALTLWMQAQLSQARSSQADRTITLTVLQVLIGAVYVTGGLRLTLGQPLNTPMVLATMLSIVSLLQGIMAWRTCPDVGWVITAINGGVSLTLAILILLTWSVTLPTVIWSLVGLHLTLNGFAIAIIAAAKDLSQFNVAS